jgi:hypothetical protein
VLIIATMAPLPFDPSLITDLDVSSVELDRRSTSPSTVTSIDLPAYLSSLSLSEVEALNTPPSNYGLVKRSIPLNDGLVKRAPISPMQDYSLLRTREPANSNPYEPGRGTIDPNKINMKGFFALFALIGVGMVLTAIWFFFWAKNGGFRWRKGDWDEYKSTVLRRKGTDGKTLSGATKSTALGGGSVVGAGYRDDDGSSLCMSEMVDVNIRATGKNIKAGKGKKGKKAQDKAERLQAQREEKWEGGADDDVRAYRHEKPARVGGLNRLPDGFYNDADSDPSAWTQSQANSNSRRHNHSPHKHQNGHREPSSSGYSFTVGSEDAYTNTSEDRRPLRNEHRASASHQQTQRQCSPRKQRTSMPGSYADPIDFSTEYLESGSESNGTKSYYHPIPGLSPGKTGCGNGGFRRGGGGRRRDSLSESEGEDSRV